MSNVGDQNLEVQIFRSTQTTNKKGTAQMLQVAEPPTCGVYIAKSGIPHAGLGLFAGRDFSEKSVVGLRDIMIPVGYSDRRETGVMIKHYDWFDWSHGHAAETLLLEEGTMTSSMILGHGILANCVKGLSNIVYSSMLHDSDFGSGANLQGFTPYHDIKVVSTREIATGSELFLDYCEDGSNDYTIPQDAGKLIAEFFKLTEGHSLVSETLGKSIVQLIRERKSFGSRSTAPVVEPFLQLMSGKASVSQKFKTDLWRIIRETADERTRDKLPESLEELNAYRSSGELLENLEYQKTRSLTWLLENGLCVDYLRVGGSTILAAGRGAFTKVFLAKGSVITPCPLIQMDRAVLEKKYVLKQGDNVQIKRLAKLLLNYCFGHEKSSILLCPFGSASHLINHSSKKANAELRWSRSSTTTGLMNSTRLEASIKELISLETPADLLLEYVATRDILPGEEIFINYGSAWDDAWNKYHEDWNTEFGWPTKGHLVADKLLHADQLVDNSFRTACLYNFEAMADVKTEDLNLRGITMDALSNSTNLLWDWVYASDPTQTLGGMYPCDIYSHETDATGRTWFTAKISPFEIKYDFEPRLVHRIPRDAIVLVNDKWADLNRGSKVEPFRHHIAMPENIFPRAWLNL